MCGAKSLAEKFLEENHLEDDNFRWLITYDFIEKKPPPRFWKNLIQMTEISTVSRIQYSVLLADNKGDAYAAVDLVRHYGGDVLVFSGEQVRG